jgi:hypothetical protein
VDQRQQVRGVRTLPGTEPKLGFKHGEVRGGKHVLAGVVQGVDQVPQFARKIGGPDELAAQLGAAGFGDGDVIGSDGSCSLCGAFPEMDGNRGLDVVVRLSSAGVLVDGRRIGG